MQLVLVSGLSGSGKSIALGVLEDSGSHCIDNIPVRLLEQTLDLLAQSGTQRVALSIDARSGGDLDEVPQRLAALRSTGTEVRVLFLDTRDEILLKRFSETRRRHPLARGNRTLEESLLMERGLLAPLSEIAHRIDTSELSPGGLRNRVREFLGAEAAGLTLVLQSFGFKQGLPLDSDLVFDVRCLPNPHYEPRLRPMNGRDPEVIEFLEREPQVGQMLDDIAGFVARWLPMHARDNRSYFTVALGCTGGQHRSVYLVERLAARFRSLPAGATTVLVRHRQLDP